MLLFDLAAAEFGRGHEEPEVRVVGGEFPPFRSLVSRAIEFSTTKLEGSAADRTEGFLDPKIPLRRRELIGGFDLDHLGEEDDPEEVHVVNVLGILTRYISMMDR